MSQGWIYLVDDGAFHYKIGYAQDPQKRLANLQTSHEKLSPAPYLEMFSRRSRLGWDTWGNEALNHVELRSAGGVST